MAGLFSKAVHCSCKDIHCWDKSCLSNTALIFSICFKNALKIYGPLYMATSVITRRNKAYWKNKLWKEILQSSLFLGSNGGFLMALFCTIRKLYGKFTVVSSGVLPGAICSYLAICIERKARRSSLAIYMLNQAFETSFNILKENGLAKDLPFGEVMIFMVAISILMCLYRSNALSEGFIESTIRKGLGEAKGDTTEQLPRTVSTYNYVQQTAIQSGKAFVTGYGMNAVLNTLLKINTLFKSPSKLIRTLFHKSNSHTGAFTASLVALIKLAEMTLARFSTNISLNAAIAGSVAGLSMCFLRSSYIALYTFTKALELAYMHGIEKGFLPYIEWFDKVIYATSCGIMFYAAILQPLHLKPSYWNFLQRLTDNKFMEIDRKKWDAFGLDSTKIDRLIQQGIKQKK